MFGAMTSLTGGGGLSAPTASSTGAQSQDGNMFSGGGVTFNKGMPEWVWFAGAALVALWIVKK